MKSFLTPWSILQYFQPSLSYHLSLRPYFCLFLSGRFTQVLLYCMLCHHTLNYRIEFPEQTKRTRLINKFNHHSTSSYAYLLYLIDPLYLETQAVFRSCLRPRARSLSIFHNQDNKIWTLMQENLSWGFANNKDADHPVPPCSLISACYSLFEETGLSLPLSETPKTGLSYQGPYLFQPKHALFYIS